MVIKARVPIIKCELNFGVAVDISLGAVNGAAAVEYIQAQVIWGRFGDLEFLVFGEQLGAGRGSSAFFRLSSFFFPTPKKQQVAALPPLRPLALIAKAVLKEAGLNQVFTGGLSSYCTTLMVIAHLQEEAAEADAAAAKASAAAAATATPSSSGAAPPPASSYALHYHRLVDMGHLLLSFFRRFGKSFDYERQAVRVSKGGVRPKPASWVLPDKPRYLLSVEDPQEQGKDIGSGTFNVMAVRECFSRAADALSAVLEREQRAGNARESGVFSHGGAVSGANAPRNNASALFDDPIATEAAWRDVQAEGSSRSLPQAPPAAGGNFQNSRAFTSLLRSIVDVDSIASGRCVARAGGGGGGGSGNAFGGGGRGGGGKSFPPLPLPFSSSSGKGKYPRGGGAAAAGAAVSPSRHHPEMHRHVAHLVPASKAPESRRMGKFAARKAREGNAGGGGSRSKGPPPPLSTSALVYQHQQQTQGWNHISIDRGGCGRGSSGRGGRGGGGRGGGGGGGGGDRGNRGGGGGGRSASAGWNNGSSSSGGGGAKKARWRNKK